MAAAAKASPAAFAPNASMAPAIACTSRLEPIRTGVRRRRVARLSASPPPTARSAPRGEPTAPSRTRTARTRRARRLRARRGARRGSPRAGRRAEGPARRGGSPSARVTLVASAAARSAGTLRGRRRRGTRRSIASRRRIRSVARRTECAPPEMPEREEGDKTSEAFEAFEAFGSVRSARSPNGGGIPRESRRRSVRRTRRKKTDERLAPLRAVCVRLRADEALVERLVRGDQNAPN